MKKIKLKSFLAILLMSSMIFSGCNKKKEENNITETNTKYDVEYAKDIIEVGEGESISLDTSVKDGSKFEVVGDELDAAPLKLFGDAKLYKFIDAPIVSGKKLDGKITINPTNIKQNKFKLSDGKELTLKEGVWPAYEKLYLAQYNDLKTGKKLKKPVVHVINVKGRSSGITPPVVSKTITSDGKLNLEWNQVKDATSYHILKRTKNSDKNVKFDQYYIYEELGKVTENNWTSTPEVLKKLAIDLKNNNGDTSKYYDLIVVAEDSSGNCTPASNLISGVDICRTLIQDIDYSKITNAIDAKTLTFETLDNLPKFMPVLTLGGTERISAVEYHGSEIKAEKTGNQEYKITIPFSLKGTSIKKEVTITKVNSDYKNKLEDKLKNIEQSTKTGRVDKNITINEKDIDSLSEDIKKNVAKVDTNYDASSSLEEFLLTNILQGNTYLSLENYPEATDKSFLINTIENILFENPIMSTVVNYNYSSKNKILQITYDSEKQAKQKECLDKISKILPTIIKEGMSDLEKSKAINDYIAKQTVYDYKAFEAIEKYNAIYEKNGGKSEITKKAYDDLVKNFGYAMDSEGVLLKGIAVCSGYAKTYYLMARMAGLQSRVVTGQATGGLHAWNLVRINNKWLVVDPTWNDSDADPNKYLNISQDDKTYTKDHVIDEKFKEFK